VTQPPAEGHDPTPRAATTPVARLRRIEAVLRDANLTGREPLPIIGVVVHANRDGLAWPGQRLLSREYHVGGATVTRALEKALGVHLVPAGLGPRGAQVYLVLAVPSDAPDDDPSATTAVALDKPAAPSETVTLDDAPAPPDQAASATGAARSATGAAVQRHRTAWRNQQSKPEDEPEREPERLPPPSARSQDGNDNGQDNDGSLTALARRAWQGGPKPKGQTERDCASTIQEHIQKHRYDLKNLALYLDATEAPGPFWQLDTAVSAFLECRDREAREAQARLFFKVRVGDSATRRDGSARGVVDFVGCGKVRVHVTWPDIDWPEIFNAADFGLWLFTPARTPAPCCTPDSP